MYNLTSPPTDPLRLPTPRINLSPELSDEVFSKNVSVFSTEIKDKPNAGATIDFMLIRIIENIDSYSELKLMAILRNSIDLYARLLNEVKFKLWKTGSENKLHGII